MEWETFRVQTVAVFSSMLTGSSHHNYQELHLLFASCGQNNFGAIKKAQISLFSRERPSREGYFLCLRHPVISSTFSFCERFHHLITETRFQAQLTARTLPVLAINCASLEDGVQNLSQKRSGETSVAPATASNS